MASEQKTLWAKAFEAFVHFTENDLVKTQIRV